MSRSIQLFPEQLQLVNQYVSEVRLWYPLSKGELSPEDIAALDRLGAGNTLREWEYYEFFVTLKDGSLYEFYACTPEFLRDYFTREGSLCFLTPGLVVVSEISVDSILAAIEKALHEAAIYNLDVGHFGHRYHKSGF